MMGCNHHGAALSTKQKELSDKLCKKGEDLSIRREQWRAVTGQGGSFQSLSTTLPRGTGQEMERDGAEDKTLER